MRPSTYSLVIALAVLVAGCAPSRVATVEPSSQPLANENLHSVLWTQTSVEFAAVAMQVFQLATHNLDDALADTAWTASVEQASRGNFGTLEPAVVLDIDETVLDNSRYQARLVQNNEEYERETWQEWVREEAATAIPGALDFVREAERRGIAIIYLSNRRAETEDATRANLRALGFPVAENFDAVVSRGEQSGWDTSDKRTRREAVADRFRILMLLGDNLGDFLSDVDQSVQARRELTAPYSEFWGQRWFMLPNPQYGSWESALFDNDYSLSREQRLRAKREHLDTGQ